MNRTRHERDYIERTIATVRNHRDADNCWPQWANIFADEIERLWRVEDSARTFRDLLHEARDQLCGCDRPANPNACGAPEETWGAFAPLARKNERDAE